MRRKISVIGAGMVGSTTAQRLIQKDYADIVLVDIIEGLPQGKALDLLQSAPVEEYDSNIIGTNDYAETEGSDIVVVTSGVPRKPGMTRDDLVLTNSKIIRSVTEQIAKYSPNAKIIMVANPLDAMAQLAFQISGFSKNRVVGMAGILDTARFRTFIAQELNVSIEDVQAFVLGGHGDTMVPLIRLTTVGGIPIGELMPKDKIDSIVERTKNGGAEIVKLLKSGSAYYAPSAAVAQMVDAIVFDKKRILPCAAYLEGEYGINGLFVGVPVLLGANGVERVEEIKLTDEESEALKRSAAAVQELIDVMKI